MASGKDFVEFVADQLREAGKITYRKMFGEYGVYCDGKLFALVCDDQFFVKITEEGRKLWPGAYGSAAVRRREELFSCGRRGESGDDDEACGRHLRASSFAEVKRTQSAVSALAQDAK